MFGSLRGISSPYEVDMANILAKNDLFTHKAIAMPADWLMKGPVSKSAPSN